MNLLEVLLLADARLRPLIGADESALQAVLDEVAAGPRPAGVAPAVSPRAVLAGQLVSIEQECRMLREALQVPLTVVARVDETIESVSCPIPAEPDDTDETDR